MTDASEYLIAEMQDEGHRVRPLRRGLVEIFAMRRSPLTLKEIQDILGKKRIVHHRVSLHRELRFLLSWHIIAPVTFADGSTRYESNTHGHHHHLICTGCSEVVDIEIPEGDLIKMGTKFADEHSFSINEHSLEFFGLCKKCKRS
jgi:Fur family ferric uptake transcriptional regulator